MEQLAEEDGLLIHPFVLGELQMGNNRALADLLALLTPMQRAPQAEEEEVAHLVRRYKLQGSGIGWIDAHLAASARLAGAELWTLDKALKRVWGKITDRT